MKFQLSNLALKYCKGTGLEIGASAHNSFGLNAINIAPDDDYEFYKSEQIKMCGEVAKIDVYAEGDNLPFDNNSQDFVINSHVIEHMPNTIKALKEWHRIVKPNGIVFIICPKRDALASDRPKPLTTLDHILEDYKLGRTIETHKGDRRGHYHIWTFDTFLKMINTLPEFEVVASQETDDKVGNGFTWY
jgi:ubiquinone/menaquinone biosynthesis C-methylase UbiE